LNPVSLVYLSLEQAFADCIAKLTEYNNIELCQAQMIADVLIDRTVALVFVDGAHDHWRQPLLAIKNNAATRRVPICFASDDGALRAEAVICGADLALSWSELRGRIQGIISDIARVPDSATLDQLACECRQIGRASCRERV